MLRYHHIDCLLGIIQVEVIVLLLFVCALRRPCFVGKLSITLVAALDRFDALIFALDAAFALRASVIHFLLCEKLSLDLIDRERLFVTIGFVGICHSVEQ